MKILLFIAIICSVTMVSGKGRDISTSKITKVVMLGSGTPNSDPNHDGPSLAVVVNDTPYLVDFGAGVVRNASAVTPRYGGTVKALRSENLKHAFLTHLHSDHTVGYPDLILTPWVLGRDRPLKVIGPEGTERMTKHILEAYRDDINYRVYGLEPANNQGWRVDVTEIIEEGVVYQDSNIVVEAFPVIHGSWPNAWGFRFTTPDMVIVVSGDTKPCESLMKYGKGADLLIHEAYYKKAYDKRSQFWKDYHADNHTSTLELADIANELKPKRVVIYHTLFWGGSEQDMLDEVGTIYDGEVIISRDLDVY